MPDRTHWTVALDETAAAWNTLEWMDANVANGDSVRLLTVQEHFGDTRERSASRLTLAEHHLESRHRDLRIERVVTDGPTIERLLRDATPADVLVIGGRRSDRIWAALTGRIAERVIAHATMPVVVVPERWRRKHDADAIVTGVDSRTAADALAFAAGRAERTRDGLVLVRAWEPPTSVSPFGLVYLERDRPLWEHEAQLELDAAIRAVGRSHPDLRMRGELRQGRPSEVLQRAATSAALIVIGRRRRSALAAFLAGSVGEVLLHRAQTPVCVVPDRSS